MCNLSIRLLEERKKLGLNQDQMAEKGRVAKRTYCNYEKGDRSPDGDFLAAIAEAGADVLYIVTGMRTPQPSTESLTAREAALLDNYRNVEDEADKKVIERTAFLAAQADNEELKKKSA